MSYLRNERGIALVTALMLTLITLVIVMALMYFIESGIRVSAASKRYKNVRQAAMGGVSLTVNELMPRLENALFGNYTGAESVVQALKADYSTLNFSDLNCLKQKLGSTTDHWGVCSSTLNAKSGADMTFVLKSSLMNFTQLDQGYIVYTKIVDTSVIGNTDPAEQNSLHNAENVTESYKGQGGTGVTLPTTYRIEVQAEMQQNPLERARFSVVYAY